MSNRSSPSVLGGVQRAGWAELDSGEVVALADRWQRLSSRFLDLLLFGLPALVLLNLLPDDKVGLFNLAFFSLLVAGIVYEVVLVAVWGQTLGRRAANLKVICATNRAVPGWARSILRCAIMCSFILTLSLCSWVSRYAYGRGLGAYVWATLGVLLSGAILWESVARRRKRRGCRDGLIQDPDNWRGGFLTWHDRVSGTLVVTQASSSGESRWPRPA